MTTTTTTSANAELRKRVEKLRSLPSSPAVLQRLLDLLRRVLVMDVVSLEAWIDVVELYLAARRDSELVDVFHLDPPNAMARVA